MAMIGAVGTHSTGQRFAWRGLSSADYTVLSSLHRDLGVSSNEASVRKAEDETISRAHEWGLGVAKLGLVDDFQLLADLQHYGVPTRLIDVTSDPITALWFACQRPSAEDVILDGLIVAINTTSYGHTLALTPADGTYATFGATHSSSRSKALSQPQPFTVRAAEANPRLASQAGFFISGQFPTSQLTYSQALQSISPHTWETSISSPREVVAARRNCLSWRSSFPTASRANSSPVLTAPTTSPRGRCSQTSRGSGSLGNVREVENRRRRCEDCRARPGGFLTPALPGP